MIVNKTTFNVGLASLVNPILGIFFGLYNILILNRINKFFLAFNISLLYCYLPLLWDNLSNYYYIEVFYDPFTANWYQRIIFNFLNIFDIQYIYAVFIVSLLISYLALDLISHLNTQNKSLFRGAFLILVVIYCLDYRYLMDLQKFSLATFICIYATLRSEKKFLKYSLLLIAWLLHPFTLIFSLAYAVIFYVNKKRTYFILFIVLSIIGVLLIPYVTEVYLKTLSPTVYVYLTDFSTENRYSNPYAVYMIYFCRSLLIVFSMYIILAFGDFKNKISKLLSASLIIVLIFLNNYIFFERAFLFFSIVAVLCILSMNLSKRLVYISILIIGLNLSLNIIWISSVVFTPAYNTVYKSNKIKESNAFKPIYYPSIILIDLKSHGYSDDKISEATYLR